MDSEMMSIVNAFDGMKQMQLQSTIQTSLLRTSLDMQTQAVEQLLSSTPGPEAPVNPPYLGQNLDIRI
jgi:hypothetical protein